MKTKIFSMLLVATALFSSCKKDTDLLQHTNLTEESSDYHYVYQDGIISASEINLNEQNVIYYGEANEAYVFDNNEQFLEWAKTKINFESLKLLIEKVEELKEKSISSYETQISYAAKCQKDSLDSLPVDTYAVKLFSSPLIAQSRSLASSSSYSNLAAIGFDNLAVAYVGAKTDVAFFVNPGFGGAVAICPATLTAKSIPLLVRGRVSSVITN